MYYNIGNRKWVCLFAFDAVWCLYLFNGYDDTIPGDNSFGAILVKIILLRTSGCEQVIQKQQLFLLVNTLERIVLSICKLAFYFEFVCLIETKHIYNYHTRKSPNHVHCSTIQWLRWIIRHTVIAFNCISLLERKSWCGTTNGNPFFPNFTRPASWWVCVFWARFTRLSYSFPDAHGMLGSVFTHTHIVHTEISPVIYSPS